MAATYDSEAALNSVMTAASTSGGETARTARKQWKREPPWWALDLRYSDIDPSTRDVLENYSDIPPDHVVAHCKEIRERGWDIFHYVCIGQFRFLDLSLGQSELYQEILKRVKDGQRYLDLGCCFGQDIRRLVADGAPDGNLVGVELEPKFIELGYELFKDGESLKAWFVTADIFDEDPKSPFNDDDLLKGTVDIIHASSFFHLFVRDEQKKAMSRALLLLAKRPGNLITGRQMGVDQPMQRFSASSPGSTRWVHSPQSLKEIWLEVAQELGVKVRVETREVPGTRVGKEEGVSGFMLRYQVWLE